MVKVYAVVCSITGKAYIGLTTGKLAKRFREHKCLAKSGKHHSPALCQEWFAYGDEAFSIVELESLPETTTLVGKREAELKWLKQYEAAGLLLNTAVISFSPTPDAIKKGIEASRHVAGDRWTDEANEKRRQAQLGVPKGHGAKISATKQRLKRERMMR